METGLTVKGAGNCKGMVLTLQNMEVVKDFLPLELGNGRCYLGYAVVGIARGNAGQLDEFDHAFQAWGCGCGIAR